MGELNHWMLAISFTGGGLPSEGDDVLSITHPAISQFFERYTNSMMFRPPFFLYRIPLGIVFALLISLFDHGVDIRV